jgi:hypothetical protein
MYLTIIYGFKYALMMPSNSIKMIKPDRNMSRLRQILCKKCNFNIGAFVVFVVSVVY